MPKPHPTAIAVTPAPHSDMLLVCRKCSKKLSGGFGPEGDDTLSRALKHELRRSGRRSAVRIVDVKCLGLCPKGAVTVIPGRTPGTMLTVPGGTDPASLLAMLSLSA